jgi:hypothetical protein
LAADRQHPAAPAWQRIGSTPPRRLGNELAAPRRAALAADRRRPAAPAWQRRDDEAPRRPANAATAPRRAAEKNTDNYGSPCWQQKRIPSPCAHRVLSPRRVASKRGSVFFTYRRAGSAARARPPRASRPRPPRLQVAGTPPRRCQKNISRRVCTHLFLSNRRRALTASYRADAVRSPPPIRIWSKRI